jgi:hypothetical protein
MLIWYLAEIKQELDRKAGNTTQPVSNDFSQMMLLGDLYDHPF